MPNSISVAVGDNEMTRAGFAAIVTSPIVTGNGAMVVLRATETVVVEFSDATVVADVVPDDVPDDVVVEEPQAASATTAPTNQSPRFMDASCRSRWRTRTTGQTGARTTLPRGFSFTAQRGDLAQQSDGRGPPKASQLRDSAGFTPDFAPRAGAQTLRRCPHLEQPAGAHFETQ